MYINKRQSRVMAAFMEALLPDAEFAAVRRRLGETGNRFFDPRRFDDPVLRASPPAIFTIFFWLPVLCFWLTWKPLPFTWLSIKDRQKLFVKLEHSRLYALRGLYLVGKMYCCMLFFQDESTWAFVGYDDEGQLPTLINPTALDDLRRQGTAQEASA